MKFQMKVKLIKLKKSFWRRDKWVECDEIFDINDNYIPNEGDFFILENTNTFYKCLGRVIYGNVGMKLYVEDIKNIDKKY